MLAACILTAYNLSESTCLYIRHISCSWRPLQPTCTPASRPFLETDGTAISILGPPEPRVNNTYSPFVHAITLMLCVFRQCHSCRCYVPVVLNVSYSEPTSTVCICSEWILAPSWCARPRARFTHHSLGPDPLPGNLPILKWQNLNWTAVNFCPWTMTFPWVAHKSRRVRGH